MKNYDINRKGEIMMFKVGDIVRYSSGKTALMRLDWEYSQNYKCKSHGYRLYGIQFFGGAVGAYERDCKLATKEEIELFNSRRNNE